VTTAVVAVVTGVASITMLLGARLDRLESGMDRNFTRIETRFNRLETRLEALSDRLDALSGLKCQCDVLVDIVKQKV
jgi:hypothetical protein